jgi:serine/threonine protein kinase/Tol biopolymer transport system component
MLDSDKLSHYELLEKLGEGGMGVVYKARDTRLDRLVALKVLPADKVSDPDRKRRFMQEAKAASALNHPNIVTIYDVDHVDGLDFIAMEYVPGRTLEQLIGRQGLKVDETLKYSIQIAGALGAAHAASIVHRDLKPNNVIVTDSGVVKVLDFGLAKLIEEKQREEAETQTILRQDAVRTLAGFIVGTAAYMSPEQAEGRPVDARSDIFSFGSLLYQTVTGQTPFARPSQMSTLAAILREEPQPPSQVAAGTPCDLDKIIARCLRKDPDRRYQHMLDVKLALEEVAEESTSSGPRPAARRTPSRHFKLGIAIAAIAAVALIAGWLLRMKARPIHTVWIFSQLTDAPGPELFPSLSPDGKTFVYAAQASGNWDIFVHRVGGRNPTNLTAGSTAGETQPVFSPDGEHIAFRSERDGGGIFIMGATGEAVRRLTDFGFNPSWSPDSKSVVVATESIVRPEDRYLPVSRLWTIDVSTQLPLLLSPQDGVQPHWSPNGHRIAFWASKAGQRDIWTIGAGGSDPVPVTSDQHVDWNPVWSPDGRYLFFISDRSGPMNLWRVPVDERSGSVLGDVEPVTTPSSDAGPISLSRNGRIAYAHQVSTARLHKVGFDPETGKATGPPVQITGGSRQAVRPDLSADGKWLTFCSWGRQQDILLVRTDGTDLRQLTDDGYHDRGPRWSPGGEYITFFTDRSGKNEIWAVHPDGSGLQQISDAQGNIVWPVWSPDGKRLAYTVFGASRSPYLIEGIRLPTEQEPRPLAAPADPRDSFNAWDWSPDGEKLAGFLQTDEGMFSGIAVYSFKTAAYTKLTDFGIDPIWLSDSRRLLFNHDGRLWLVDSDTRRAREVLSLAPQEIARRGFAVSPDDRTIYFSLASTESDIWLAQSR